MVLLRGKELQMGDQISRGEEENKIRPASWFLSSESSWFHKYSEISRTFLDMKRKVVLSVELSSYFIKRSLFVGRTGTLCAPRSRPSTASRLVAQHCQSMQHFRTITEWGLELEGPLCQSAQQRCGCIFKKWDWIIIFRTLKNEWVNKQVLNKVTHKKYWQDREEILWWKWGDSNSKCWDKKHILGAGCVGDTAQNPW